MNRALVVPVILAAVLSACSSSKTEAPATPAAEQAGLVPISSEAQKHFGIQVAPARVSELNEYLQVPGTVQPIDSQVNTVRPLARGRLHDVLVRIGDRVTKGQTLARYDNIEAGELASQLASARADLERLSVQQRNLKRQTERSRALAELGAIPAKEFELASTEQQAAEQTIRAQQSSIRGIEARLARFGSGLLTSITAPISGVITRQEASPGEVIESSTALFTIADLSKVWVQAEVYEKDLGRVRLGQQATVKVDTYPNEPFTGRVTYISDFLDPKTRTAKVRCEVPNAGIRLKLDMFANVSLPTTFSRRTLAVPVAAVQEVGDRRVVFVRKTDTAFEPRWVTAGTRVGDLIEITQGLTEGEPVVTAGAFHLKSILVGKDLGEE